MYDSPLMNQSGIGDVPICCHNRSRVCFKHLPNTLPSLNSPSSQYLIRTPIPIHHLLCLWASPATPPWSVSMPRPCCTPSSKLWNITWNLSFSDPQTPVQTPRPALGKKASDLLVDSMILEGKLRAPSCLVVFRIMFGLVV